ncbi:MAG: hypothetical protein D3908_03055 [Candidatus Electrothrix sp. AUS4]|nr:hypothetical protein [Candidatus Electrothrix sp. AUS4]
MTETHGIEEEIQGIETQGIGGETHEIEIPEIGTGAHGTTEIYGIETEALLLVTGKEQTIAGTTIIETDRIDR